jgi:hypothetical protein
VAPSATIRLRNRAQPRLAQWDRLGAAPTEALGKGGRGADPALLQPGLVGPLWQRLAALTTAAPMTPQWRLNAAHACWVNIKIGQNSVIPSFQRSIVPSFQCLGREKQKNKDQKQHWHALLSRVQLESQNTSRGFPRSSFAYSVCTVVELERFKNHTLEARTVDWSCVPLSVYSIFV